MGFKTPPYAFFGCGIGGGNQRLQRRQNDGRSATEKVTIATCLP